MRILFSIVLSDQIQTKWSYTIAVAELIVKLAEHLLVIVLPTHPCFASCWQKPKNAYRNSSCTQFCHILLVQQITASPCKFIRWGAWEGAQGQISRSLVSGETLQGNSKSFCEILIKMIRRLNLFYVE